jgi:hypothetical protein
MFVAHIVYFRNDAPERSSAERCHLTIGLIVCTPFRFR